MKDKYVFNLGGTKHRFIYKMRDDKGVGYMIRSENSKALFLYYDGENEVVDNAYKETQKKDKS